MPPCSAPRDLPRRGVVRYARLLALQSLGLVLQLLVRELAMVAEMGGQLVGQVAQRELEPRQKRLEL